MKPIRLPRLWTLLPIMALVAVADNCPEDERYDPPTLATATSPSNLGATKVTIQGNVTNEGGSSVSKKGVVYTLTKDGEDLSVENEAPGVRIFEEDGTGTGSFTINLTGLDPGSEYTFRAIARNEYGRGDSGSGTFTTLALEVASPTVTDVTDTSATLGGEVISDVGGMITERGVVFMPYDDYEIDQEGADNLVIRPGVTQRVAAGTGTGVFTVNATTGIAPGVEYIFKAYASIGSDDTVYSEVSFFPNIDTGAELDVLGDFVSAFAALPDGKVLVGGNYEEIDGEVRSCLARLLDDGSFDDSFTSDVDGFDSTYPNWLQTFAVQKDGKVLLGGVFNRVNGAFTHANLARLNADGTEDTTFLGRVGAGNIETIAFDGDGKILVGGYLIDLNSNPRYYYMGRLNADGSLDTTFNPGPATYDPGAGPNATVSTIAVQPDGKILISGFFNEYSGVARPGLARLNPNGSLDTGFDPSATLFNTSAFVLQPDGKLLVSGFITGGYPGLVRLESDGSLDTTFSTASIPANIVVTESANPAAVVLQADGKILIGGSFSEVHGVPRDHLARLEADGSLDGGFDPTVGYDIAGVGLAENGLIVVGGLDYGAASARPLVSSFANTAATGTLLATSPSRIEWLRGGGAPEVFDVTFESSVNGGATWTALPGKATKIPGGWELTGLSLSVGADLRARGRTSSGQYGGSSGLVEQSTISDPQTGTVPTVINRTQIDILSSSARLGGDVTSDGGSGVTERGVVVSRTYDNRDPRVGGADVRKFTDSGTTGVFSVDVSGLVLGTNYSFRAYATNSGGTGYTTVGQFKTQGLPQIESPNFTDGGGIFSLGARITHDGGSDIIERGVIYSPKSAGNTRLLTKENGTKLVDPSSPGVGYYDIFAPLDPSTEYVFVAYATNGVGTSYTSPISEFTTPSPGPSEQESGNPVGAYGSFLEGGTLAPSDLDAGFDAGLETGGLVQVLAEQADGKILVAGRFATVAGPFRSNLARLNDDGSVDSSFDARTDGAVYSVQVQPDGRILIGGLFTRVNGVARTGVARLEADGTLESALTFSPAMGVDNAVYAVALQPDGKILLGGLFETIQGTPRKGIARLKADGSLDSAFDPGTGFDDSVYCIALQSDGRILVGGGFENFDGTVRGRIARLEDDGDLDTTFNPGTGADDRVTSMAVQADGKILLGGWFGSYNGSPRNRIARLLTSGGIDDAFNPGSGANDHIYSMALQVDGKILVGGLFQTINGVSRNRIARLNPDASVDTTFDAGTGADGEVDALTLKEDGSILVGGLFQFVDGVARNGIARLENDAATQSLTVVDGTQLTWLRGGSGPEVLPANFEVSTDSGVTWTELGIATRVAGGWSIAGRDLPINGLVRALGRTSGGFLGGSGGIVEEFVDYNHQPLIDALRTQLVAANANASKLTKQIKAAKKKKNKAKVKKLTLSLKKVQAQISKLNADLAKY